MLLLKVKNCKTRSKGKLCLKLKIKNTERRHWHHSGIFIVDFEQVDARGLIQEKSEKSAHSLVDIAKEKTCVPY